MKKITINWDMNVHNDPTKKSISIANEKELNEMKQLFNSLENTGYFFISVWNGIATLSFNYFSDRNGTSRIINVDYKLFDNETNSINKLLSGWYVPQKKTIKNLKKLYPTSIMEIQNENS